MVVPRQEGDRRLNIHRDLRRKLGISINPVAFPEPLTNISAASASILEADAHRQEGDMSGTIIKL
jgi:hypothetical protein